MEYIRIVPVQFCKDGKVYLFRTRGFKPIKKGDIVMVDSNGRDRFGTVASEPIDIIPDPDNHTYEIILSVSGASHPLKKVLGIFEPIKYEEGEE